MRLPYDLLVAALIALPLSTAAHAQAPTPPVSAPASDPRIADTKPAEARPADAKLDDATPADAKPGAAVEPASMDSLSWISGCWRGTANQREFREHWLPLRGNLLVGAGHTVMANRTQDFEYMRIEPRADGIYYVAVPSGQRETAFKLASRQAEGPDTIFTFANPSNAFPQSIIYRRATGGWLYVHVEGKLNGEDRRVIYPLRRIDCEGGEFIER